MSHQRIALALAASPELAEYESGRAELESSAIWAVKASRIATPVA
jgi:hypothetical protein